MKSAPSTLSRLLLCIAAFLLAAGTVQARRGFILITSGDTISDLGRVRGQFLAGVKQERGPTLDHVGFKYEYFGVFWLDFWNWGGEYCIFADKTFYPVSKSQAAELLGIAERNLEAPLNYRFPLGLSIVVGMGLFRVVPRLLVKKGGRPAGETQFNSGERIGWTPPPPQSSGYSAEAPPVPPAGYAATPPPLIAPQAVPAACAPPMPPPIPSTVFQSAACLSERSPAHFGPSPGPQKVSPSSLPPPLPPENR